ncbi:MAG: MFS transporter [Desulfobacteraceae bacterium]
MPANWNKNFIGLASFEMLAMFRRGLFYAYLTIYLRHFLGLSVTATTLFATLPMVVNILSQGLIWGRISDRYQLRRSLIIIGELLAALGTVAVWYLHRGADTQIVAGYILIFGLTAVEFFWSMSNISWSALIADLYPQNDRSRIQGRLASLGGIGRIAGILIGGLLYDGFGMHFSGWGFHHGVLFFVAAGIMLASTFPLLLLPEGGIHETSTKAEAPFQQKVAATDSVQENKIFLFFLTAMTLINFGRNSIAIIFPQYLSADTGPGLDSRSLSYVLNTQSLSMIFFGWWAGWFCRRLGTNTTLVTATFSAVAAMSVLAWATALPAIYLGSFLRGIADATIMAAAYEIAAALIPAAHRARRFAWFNATFFLSWGLPGTLIAGPLVDILISGGSSEAFAYRISFAVAGVITAAGLLFLSILLYRRRRMIA